MVLGPGSDHDRGTAPAQRMLNVQQATVNLFADMGVQPATLQAGLVAASRVDRHDRADLDDHLADGRGGPAARARPSRSPARPPTRAAAWWRGRGLGRRRHDLAPRHGARTGATPGRRRAPGAVTIKSRAVDDSGNLETPAARRHGQSVSEA